MTSPARKRTRPSVRLSTSSRASKRRASERPLDSSPDEAASSDPTRPLQVDLCPSPLYCGPALQSLRALFKDSPPPSSSSSSTAVGRLALSLDARSSGDLLAVGVGDTGQLGLGPGVSLRRKPQLVSLLPHPVVQACAGGMHSVVLTAAGLVYSWGCNDDQALGRDSAGDDDDSEHSPRPVSLPRPAVQVSAGDSHSAALLDDGTVFAWGTFRDTNGVIGLTRPHVVEPRPVRVGDRVVEPVVKIASGGDHLALLTVAGRVYSFGGAEQGQLSRVGRQMSYDGGRTGGMDRLLEPAVIRCRSYRDIKRPKKFADLWCGQYSTFLKEEKSRRVLAAGLNNYHQLGHESPVCHYAPVPVALDPAHEWVKIAAGMHHTIALTADGKVFAFGRPEYGRLGLGGAVVVAKPQQITAAGFDQLNIVDIAAGSAVSFAVTDSGKVYSWGMGTNLQTGHGEDDVEVPTMIESKQIDLRKVTSVSAGGQHTLFIGKLIKEDEEQEEE